MVPEQDQAVQFSRLIVNQAAQSGVSINNMSGGRQASMVNNPFFVEQNETIQLQSGVKQLVDFLYNLGAGASLIRVKVLTVQPDAAHQGLSTHVTLVASYQKEIARRRGRSSGLAPAVATPKPAVAAPKPADAVPKPADVAPKPVAVVPKSPPTNHALPTLPSMHNPLTPTKK